MTIKQTTAILLISLGLLLGQTAQAAQSPEVMEAFACNFQPGKNMADLEKTIEYYQSQRSKMNSAAINRMRSVIWQPVRGRVPYDLIWLNNGVTLSEWGEATAALADTSAGQAVEARFNEVLNCEASGVYTNEELYRTDDGPIGDSGYVIESHRCQLHEEQTIADSTAAVDTWRPVFARATKAAGTPAIVMRRLPVISASGFDLNYVVVWSDLESFANGNSTYRTDPATANADAQFARVHRCESALFNGRFVVNRAE